MSAGPDLFADGGDTGALMARLDWAATPVGPVTDWPATLRAAVRLVLSSRYPMLLLWGSEFTQLYNDAYSALIGAKHPAALGGDVRITLAEGWDVLRPIIEEALSTGVASWVPALRLRLDRAGYPEEAYFSVSHAAIRDDRGGNVGVFAVCSEVTEQVVGERRLRLLRDLSLRGGQTSTAQHTCDELIGSVAEHPLDVPFAAIYLRDGDLLRRMAGVGFAPAGVTLDDTVLPSVLPLRGGGSVDRWALRRAAAGEVGTVSPVTELLTVPAGPWGDPVDVALALPLPSADRTQPLGVLLVGVSPSRGLDEAYRSFVGLLSQQVSVAVRNARAYEEERARAEALAELDRVKTDFFTNVSHEFRTPLTLMLGPLADALADPGDPLSAGQRSRVDTAWRNANRLLRLVNNLLSFASLEAGRAPRSARPVDLPAATTELVGVFRAAVERAGLRLVVDCPPLPRAVVLDPTHWETIVANLLSNALKFTFVGHIRVALSSDGGAVRLTVADTGIGIAARERSRLFERFHRVRGARSRSHEGSGIGLALVQELVRLQGGDVEVASELGVGTTFTVEFPWSAVQPTATVPPSDDPAAARPAAARPAEAARPADAAAVPAANAAALPDGASQAPPIGSGVAYAAAQEALQWVAGEAPAAAAPAPTDADPDPPDDPLRDAHILVADDNADMRAYLTRLLTAQGWQVEAVGDGEAALAAVRRRRPDLVLTDVMMPRLDGFQLLRALRRDDDTATVPVVVVSARAGREASVEGLALGADDYVVKPFSAPELMARVRGTMRLARARAAHTRPPPEPVDAADLVAAGRAMEAAVRSLTEQARALLAGRQAVTTLTDAGGNPRLRVAVPDDAVGDPGTPVVSTPVAPPDPGQPVGTLVVRGGDRPFGSIDRELLRPVGQMLATLARRTWRAGQDPPIAAALRRDLLPGLLPDIAGCEVAVGHPRAGADADVGGDWYDVCQLADGRVLLAVGEVAGSGLAAVTMMGQLRAAARAYAAHGDPPAAVLDRLGAVLRRMDPGACATALIGYLDPVTGGFQWCSAGHPAPLRIAAGQPARWLPGVPGGPLGTLTGRPDTSHATLPPGAVLLFCTDPTMGDRGAATDERTLVLQRRAGEVQPGAGHVRDIVDAVLVDGPDGDGDDTPVLAVRRDARARTVTPTPISEVDSLWTYPADPYAAAAMRRDLRRALQQADVDSEAVFDLLIAASEAVNNAVEHAQRPTRPQVEVRLSIADGTARVAVRDFGSWRGRRPAMDRGRGAALMSAVAQVRVLPTERGTTVVIERAVSTGR